MSLGIYFVNIFKTVFMKRAFLYFFFCLTLGVNQSCNEKNDNDKKDNINTSDVPAAVISAFNAKFPGATDVEWKHAKEDGKPSYKAKYKINGKKVKAEFGEDGSFIKAEDD